MQNCIFCKIIAREIPGDIVFEDDSIIAFRDIQPLAPVHVLVVPKEHYRSLDELPSGDLLNAGNILLAIKNVAEQLGVSGGYKVVTNCGEPAGQVVPHLHFHILAGKKFVP
ncbi:MAG: histidine triad nucleotide-binding protein [Clostridiales bacterium]|jgi:histidine triad (HIT) family protein|nr:histidine triad nucleotide-binding protein [Clostridiales bacterium]